MGLVRVLRTTPAQVSHTFELDEVLTNASAGVTVTITRLDGSAVESGAASTTSTGKYFYSLASTSVDELDTMVVTWAGTFSGMPVQVVDYVEVVGGFLFTIGQLRQAPPPLSTFEYTTQALIEKRTEIEQICETICGGAFVPRFRRVKIDGNDHWEILTPDPLIRRLRAVRIDGVALSQPTVDSMQVGAAGILSWRGGVFRSGRENVILEYECGMDIPPSDITTASTVHARARLRPTDTKIPTRALSFTVQDGGVYRLASPRKDRTGIPEVDASYEREWFDTGGFA